MRIVFARKNTLSSWLIRLFTWSRWSHVAIVDRAVAIESTFWGHGVRMRPLQDLIADHTWCEFGEVSLPDETAGIGFAYAQLGKPYDWTAIFGFVLRENWADDAKWFCSELVEASIKAGGFTRFREDLSRITPRDVWMVTP